MESSVGSKKNTNIRTRNQLIAVRALETILDQAGASELPTMHWTMGTVLRSLDGRLSDWDTPTPEPDFEKWVEFLTEAEGDPDSVDGPRLSENTGYFHTRATWNDYKGVGLRLEIGGMWQGYGDESPSA